MTSSVAYFEYKTPAKEGDGVVGGVCPPSLMRTHVISTAMLRRGRSLVLAVGLAIVAAGSTLACTSDVAPIGGDGTPAKAPSDPSPPGWNGDVDGEPSVPAPVTMPLEGAGYSNSAGGTRFALTIYFDIVNDSGEDITSIETLSYDFGGGTALALGSPACRGEFAVPANKIRRVRADVLVEIGGRVRPADFRFQCLQPEFASEGYGERGTVEGTGPTSDSFAGPIAITVGGKTKTGTFAGAVTARRFN